LIKEYEFWNPRLFEVPFYIYLGFQCLINRVGIKGLDEKKERITEFVEQHGYPVILKSNVGSVGKGIAKVASIDDVNKHTPRLLGDYILQKFTSNLYECGVFYIRQNGRAKITGINQKHFPAVVGDGHSNVLELAQNHPRYTKHWNSFLQDIDLSEVLELGVEKCVSFNGSHTLGCKFTDDLHLLTPELEEAIFSVFDSQPGFNFGRVDVKAADEAALMRGEFVVIEVNGVASLPTHMYDPKYSVWQAYGIFFQHAKYLAQIAAEQRHQSMTLLSYFDVIEKVKYNQALLNRVHRALMNDSES